MKKIKLFLLTLCVVASATMLSACSDETSSSDATGSDILSGDVVSVESEASTDLSKETSSEVSAEESTEESTEESEVASTEESADVSKEASEEASSEVSAEVSEEASSESASSEEPEISEGDQGAGMDMFVSILDAIPEEHRGLDGAKSVDSFIKKYGIKSVISVKGEIDMGTAKMGAEYIMAIDCTGETVKSSVRGIMSMSGAVMADNQSIFIEDKSIQIDHIQKNYYYSDEGVDSIIDLRFLGKDITVETKNELVGTDVFVADWFKSANGDIGIYTKDGVLKYFCARIPSAQGVMEVLLKIDASETVDSSIFEIPAGYTEANNG